MALSCVARILVLSSISAYAQLVTTTAGRQQDLNYIANTLPQLDVNFYATLNRSAYQQAVSALQAKITSATDPEFYVGLSQLVAMSGDMHTNLTPGAVFGYPSLPLSFRWLDDGLFVTAASPGNEQLIGTQVVAVNGMPIDQVVQRMGTAFAWANDQWLHYTVASRLPNLFLLEGLDILPFNPTSVSMTFQTRINDQLNVTFTQGGGQKPVSILPGPTPDYLQQSGSYYWYEYVAANRMIFAKYNVCEDDPNGISVATYASEILATLDANPVDSVVIDFRGNTGGNEYLLYPLGVGLFQRLPQLRTNPNFRIYLVIDKGSFSSGMYTPMAFVSGYLSSYEHIPQPDTAGIMYVIGEPTGGKPLGFADIVNFTLPYSKASGYYSTDFINQNEGVIPDLPTFNPDIYVHTRSTDYFAGHDPVMAAILARYTGVPATPSGAVTTVNGASFRTDDGLSPGSFAASFGSFSAIPDAVQVAGVPAAVVSAGSSQVNFIVPPALSPGLVTVSVRMAGQELASGEAALTVAGPGLFVLNSADPSQPGAIENADYSVNSMTNPVARGSALSIYATGYGPLDGLGNAPVQVYVADTLATVLYSAPVVGSPGLWQINVQVPAAVPSGGLPFFIVAGNIPSNPVTVQVK